MKKETLEEGLRIYNEIRFCLNKLEKLNSYKKDLEQKGGIDLEHGWDEIKIPFEVFKGWFEGEENKLTNEIEIFEKQLQELS